MTKHEALNQVRIAAVAVAMASPNYSGYDVQRFRQANAALARAELEAATAGADAFDIRQAAEWNGAIEP